MANVVISSHKINVYLRCRMVEPRYLILHTQWPCINCVKRYVRTEIEYRYYRFDFIKCPHAAWITGTYLYVVTVIRIKILEIFFEHVMNVRLCALDSKLFAMIFHFHNEHNVAQIDRVVRSRGYIVLEMPFGIETTFWWTDMSLKVRNFIMQWDNECSNSSSGVNLYKSARTKIHW